MTLSRSSARSASIRGRSLHSFRTVVYPIVVVDLSSSGIDLCEEISCGVITVRQKKVCGAIALHAVRESPSSIGDGPKLTVTTRHS